MNIKNNILLKKSYDVRKLMDILSNSSHVVVYHVDNITSNSILELRKNLKIKKVESFLINKDNFLNLPLVSVSKGSSLIFYAEFYFYDFFQFTLEKLLLKNKVTLFKYKSLLSNYFKNQLIFKYQCNSLKVFKYFFFLLSFYKNLIFVFNFWLVFLLKNVKLSTNFLSQYKFLNLLLNQIKKNGNV